MYGTHSPLPSITGSAVFLSNRRPLLLVKSSDYGKTLWVVWMCDCLNKISSLSPHLRRNPVRQRQPAAPAATPYHRGVSGRSLAGLGHRR